MEMRMMVLAMLVNVDGQIRKRMGGKAIGIW